MVDPFGCFLGVFAGDLADGYHYLNGRNFSAYRLRIIDDGSLPPRVVRETDFGRWLRRVQRR